MEPPLSLQMMVKQKKTYGAATATVVNAAVVTATVVTESSVWLLLRTISKETAKIPEPKDNYNQFRLILLSQITERDRHAETEREADRQTDRQIADSR